jgi:hypothetical protein
VEVREAPAPRRSLTPAQASFRSTGAGDEGLRPVDASQMRVHALGVRREAIVAAVVLGATVAVALPFDIGALRRIVLVISVVSFLGINWIIATRPRSTTWREWGIEMLAGAVVNASAGFGLGYGFTGSVGWGVAFGVFSLAVVARRGVRDVRATRAIQSGGPN